jgi:UDP-GlcNAc:undecaprenyl-phosphate GlcNAc-1-phosphate transferase
MNIAIIIFAFLLPATLTYILMPYLISFLKNHNIMDDPIESERKKHKEPVPRGGGILILAFLILTLFLAPNITSRHTLILSCIVVFWIGFLDDIKRISSTIKLLAIMAIAMLLYLSGISIDTIGSFGGGINHLDIWISALITVIYLSVLMISFNLLDGVDGLSTGIGMIASIIIFIFSLLPRIHQPDIATLAIAFCGILLGFFFYNKEPAKIYLGDSGAYLVGLFLGILSILSGTKLAISLIVLALPIVDSVLVIFRRILRHKSPFSGDRLHLHYLLIDNGWTIKKTNYFFYVFSALSGIAAIFASSIIKFILLMVLIIFIAIIVFWFDYHSKKT